MIAIMTVGLSGAGTPVAADPTLPGLGEVDGWVDATGDQMFGTLDMDVNSILFRTLALNADSSGNLQWDGDDVCVVGSVLVGCAASATGDITEVAAGTGLAGGATSGVATLSLNINGGSAQTCSGTQKVSAISATGLVTCSADADTNSGGTVTSVASGTGLAGGPITGSGTLSLSINGGSAQTCGGTQKVSAVSSTGIVTCSADSDSGGDITGVTAGFGLTGGGSSGAVSLAVDTASIQQRVTGSCPAGQSISAIGSSGSVTCVADRTPIAAAGGNNVGTAFAAGGACTNLSGASVTLTVPSAGTILLSGNAEVQFHHLAAAQEFAAFFIGTTAADCNLMTIGWRAVMDLPASATVPSTVRETIHVQSAVSVSAGTHTFFLNGAQSLGQDSANDRFIGGSLTGVFYPS